MSIENNSTQKIQPTSRTGLWTALGLVAVIALGAFFRFYQLGAGGVGNEYYAATVKSMLTSWHNFFFAAFEPGGSVTVDKPPLGFWLEALSAYFLGVTGFALALPNALAGTLAIPLLYAMVKKQFGRLAGLSAALVLAVMPVTIAAERNNTIDGMLVFTLLLAAWAVWKAVESGRFRYLLLGALFVGLGFNIKMLQAYMVLPALYALYFFGAKQAWWKRLVHLGLATGLLLVVSFTWPLIVDATPASERPFIGSSTENSVMELIVGHNGIKRILGGSGPGAAPGNGPLAANPQPGNGNTGQNPAQGFPIQPKNGVNGSGQKPVPGAAPQMNPGAGSNRPNPGQGFSPQQNAGQRPPLGGLLGQPGQPPQAPNGFTQGNRPGGPSEVGTAGPLRLFTEPLSTQASWLLPLALLGLGLALVTLGRPWPLTEKHLALLLWAGWLLPIMLYFTFTTGLWHTYYLIMLGPALAALVGATVWAMDVILVSDSRRGASRPVLSARQSALGEDGVASGPKTPLATTWRFGWGLVALLSGITLGFEIFVLSTYPAYFIPAAVLMIGLWLAGLAPLAVRPQSWALALVLFSLLVGPLLWSGLTTLTNSEANLPRAGQALGQPRKVSSGTSLSPVQQTVLDYLEANTEPGSYLAATLDSRGASPLILATGRPVLTFGGFGGHDDVISVTQLQEMVASGELRFVIDDGNLQSKPEIYQWVTATCQVVKLPGLPASAQMVNQQPQAGGPNGQQFKALYTCGK